MEFRRRVVTAAEMLGKVDVLLEHEVVGRGGFGEGIFV
jgi:hypothetical protein